MRFFEAPDGHNELTIWLEGTDADTGQRADMAILRRCDLRRGGGVGWHFWPEIVRALTAGPTIESARVVVETLKAENEALLRANAELNAELNSLRTVVPADVWDRLAES